MKRSLSKPRKSSDHRVGASPYMRAKNSPAPSPRKTASSSPAQRPAAAMSHWGGKPA